MKTTTITKADQDKLIEVLTHQITEMVQSQFPLGAPVDRPLPSAFVIRSHESDLIGVAVTLGIKTTQALQAMHDAYQEVEKMSESEIRCAAELYRQFTSMTEDDTPKTH
jgi:hypothetical protein